MTQPRTVLRALVDPINTNLSSTASSDADASKYGVYLCLQREREGAVRTAYVTLGLSLANEMRLAAGVIASSPESLSTLFLDLVYLNSDILLHT